MTKPENDICAQVAMVTTWLSLQWVEGLVLSDESLMKGMKFLTMKCIQLIVSL